MPELFAAIVFSAREWLWPSVGLLVAGAIILAIGYRKGPGSAGLRWGCFALKLLGLAALLACLLEPHWSETRPKPGANYLALAVDNSQGMTIHDPGAEQSRGAQLRERLTSPEQRWQDELSSVYQLRRFIFDSRLQAARDFKGLGFDGRASAIGATLTGLKDRFAGQPLAGILLFTDGNATDITQAAPDVTGLPPIYPVLVGSDKRPKDISVQKVTVTQTAFEDAPVTVLVEAWAIGYSGKTLVAELWERTKRTGTNAPGTNLLATGKLAQSQTATVNGEEANTSFRFTVRPEQPGIVFYDVRLFEREERAQFTSGGKPLEATLANNTRTMVVQRPEGPLRVLYVTGRPNWEFKFLNRAVEEDKQVDLVALIRIARREPKFTFKGRAGETSNPLFRGFDGKDEETERYDQPVLIRLNTRDELELRGGFPKTPEELFDYHAIILDDLESQFFTHDQMTLVQKFVSERGGGFLMLGGVDSFHQGNYTRTPIGEMLPVYLDRIVGYKSPEAAKLEFTREGWIEPWTRLRRTEAEERARIDEMPPFEIVSPIRDVKPGASVLMRVTDSSGQAQPALIVQRFGRGRTAALMIGDMWRWGLHSEEGQEDLAKGWRQMVRWLIADSPNRIDITAEPSAADLGVNLQVRARDKKFEPLDNVNVTLEVESLGSLEHSNAAPAIRLTAEPSSNEPGVYSATYVPREPGAYRVKAVAAALEGIEVGSAHTGWASDPLAEEFRSLVPNRSLMEMLANKTGGKVLALADLDDLALDLPKSKAPIVENWSYPIWHTPAIFLFALACFLTEWGLRRWKGMA